MKDGDPDAAAAYLKDALDRAGVAYSEASHLIHKSHSYISQYISHKRRTPEWLGETERRALVKAYPFLDEGRLRPPEPALAAVPPPKGGVRRDRSDQADVHPPGYGKPVYDTRELDVLRLWRLIAEERRQLALSILHNLANNPAISEVA